MHIGPAVADRLIQDKKTQVAALELKYMDLLKEKHANVCIASLESLKTNSKISGHNGETYLVSPTRSQTYRSSPPQLIDINSFC